MPFKIEKSGSKYKLFNIHKKEYVKKEFMTEKVL